MDAARWTVAIDGVDVSVALDTAQDPGATTVFVMAHGAGGNLADRGVLAGARIGPLAPADRADRVGQFGHAGAVAGGSLR